MNRVLQRAQRRFRLRLKDASEVLESTDCVEHFPGLAFGECGVDDSRQRYERYMFCVELAKAVCEKYLHASRRSGSGYSAAIEVEFLLLKDEFESSAEREWATQCAMRRMREISVANNCLPASLG